ncbi:MAG: hypothetical protein IJH32_09285 [Ruminococcus sp.]|nr:hypothetical protein [Ruminococcus sp.]
MKKVIQIISVFVLAVMVSTILCSCIQLDDLKNNRAVFLNDDKTEVLFRDNLYKRIQLKGEAIIQNETYDGRLTAADVPILLAESEGSAFSYDKTADVPTLLKQYYENYSSAYDSYYTGTKVYCLESEYDRISEINSSDKFDSMYIIYSKDYSDEDMVGYNHDYQLVYEIVSEEYHDAIDRALESDTETLIDSEEGAKSEYLDLTRCDSETSFVKGIFC